MKKQLTYAQRAEQIIKKFEGRNDNISLRTKKALMGQLREEQEAAKQAMNIPNDTNQAAYGELFQRPQVAGVNELQPTGMTPLSGGAQMTGAENLGPAPMSSGAAGGMGMPAVGGALSLIGDGINAFSKSNVDTSGATKYTPGQTKKNNTTNLVTGLAGAGAKAVSGDFIGAGVDVLKTGFGAIAGNKQRKAEEEGLMNNDFKQANEYRPSSYPSAYGGTLPGSGTDPVPKWMPMPSDADVQVQTDQRTDWGNQMKMSGAQVGAFEDQRVSDQQWNQNRDNYYQQEFSKWREGKTGVSPNSKFSQTSQPYQDAWTGIKDTWHKNNPREVNQGVQEVAQDRQAYAYGGKVNKYAGTDGPSLIKREGPVWDSLNLPTSSLNRFGQPNMDTSLKTPDFNNAFQKTQPANPNETMIKREGPVWDNLNLKDFNPKDFKTKAGKAVDWLGQNSGNIAQYANVLGSLTNKIERGATPRGTRLEGNTTLDRIDEQSLMNQLKGSVNVSGTAREGSAGSLSAYNTGTRVGNKQLLEAIGQTGTNVRQSNLQQGNAETQMNLQKQMTNMAADERFLDREAQNEGAYQSAKQQNRSALFQSAANIGREETDKKMVKEMYGYKWNGKYWVDPKGKKVSQTEYDNAVDKTQTQMQKMFGGYLKK